MTNRMFKKIAIFSILVASFQATLADTRLQTSILLEGSNSYNNIAIEHGCVNKTTQATSIPVVGTSVVFPDGNDSIVSTKPAGALVTDAATPYSGKLSDFLTNLGGGIKKIFNHDIFTQEGLKLDSNGNNLGFWVGFGSLPGQGYLGLIPLRIAGVAIEPSSCAKSVTVVLAIADVCSVTNLNGISEETVNLWTPAVGSNFDGKSTADAYDSPATLKIVRNTTGTPATLTSDAVDANPLPASCGKGLDVTVKPSAAQINRDLPAILNGKQIWPTP